jgi:hypothetical protein
MANSKPEVIKLVSPLEEIQCQGQKVQLCL